MGPDSAAVKRDRIISSYHIIGLQHFAESLSLHLTNALRTETRSRNPTEKWIVSDQMRVGSESIPLDTTPASTRTSDCVAICINKYSAASSHVMATTCGLHQAPSLIVRLSDATRSLRLSTIHVDCQVVCPSDRLSDCSDCQQTVGNFADNWLNWHVYRRS